MPSRTSSRRQPRKQNAGTQQTKSLTKARNAEEVRWQAEGAGYDLAGQVNEYRCVCDGCGHVEIFPSGARVPSCSCGAATWTFREVRAAPAVARVDLAIVAPEGPKPPRRRSSSLQRNRDHRALLTALQAQCKLFFEELKRHAPALAANRFRGVAVGAFLKRFHLDTPWLRLSIRQQAKAFSRNAGSAVPDLDLLPDIPALIKRRRVAARRDAVAARPPLAIGAEETVRAFRIRAREYAEVIVRGARDADDTRYHVVGPDTQRDIDWFFRVQVLQQTPAQIGRRDNIGRDVVDKAVRRISERLEIPLRELPRSGRPRGVVERTKRRTVDSS